MDNRVIKRFLGYLLWGVIWTVSLTGIIAGLVWISLSLTGGMHLFPMIAVIASVGSFGIYMLWRHAHHEIRHEDFHNEQRNKIIKR